MLRQKLLNFYKKNSEVLEDMLKIAQNREIGYMLENGNFGKRPYIIENETDILELIRKGAVSFHMSVERWLNPLELSAKLKKKELNELRLGWDFVIDLDSKNFEIAKYTAYLIVKFLEDRNIKPIYVKYSGGKGFHIAIPWEVFPEKVKIFKGEDIIEEETKKLFPDLARTLASYIASKIENDLLKYIESLWDIKELISELNLDILPEQFSPFHIVEIDTILISSRHLIRMPYSLNEKTGKLSIPIDKEDILKFNPEIADIDYYTYRGVPYLTIENIEKSRALEKLIYDAIKWEALNRIEKERLRSLTELQKTEEKLEEEIEKEVKKVRIKFKGEVPEEYFPPCIKNMLKGLSDGRKRAVFILINFLAHMGWSWEKIKKTIWEWNEKNEDPLRERYIEYQLQWHEERYKKGLKYLTPNCSNETYYKDMGVCEPDEICRMIKNPLSYPFKKLKVEKLRKKNK